MNLSIAIKKVHDYLAKNIVINPMLESIIIARYVLKKDDMFILSNPNLNINLFDYKKMIKIAKKRIDGYPLSYITHKKEFMGLEFYVNKNVLIPRPETENLVEHAIEYINKYRFKNILDLCTGSGSIAISIQRFTNANVIASDISYSALRVAFINKTFLKSNIFLINCNLLNCFKSGFDVIVSNPPYILPSEFETLSKEVKHEPKIALLCDEKYELIEKIIKKSKNLTKYLMLEISPNMRKFLESFQEFLYIKKDYANKDRIAVFKF
ncbi:MAG: HemK/PrmC family methyltransferase [Desulfurella sp.]|uniref:HemK/PrmC family methyltransferase n=1 Tax=Desulfurella sp. TaxID=1962857 RepID=UPI003C905D11